MSWVRLTTEQLTQRFSSRELAALQRAKHDLDDGQMAEVLENVTTYVRGFVAAHGRGLGEAGTIPPELTSPALDIALVRYSTSVAGVLIDPKGIRQKAADKADELLRDVSRGLFTVEDPVDAASAAHPGPAIEDPVSIL